MEEEEVATSGRPVFASATPPPPAITPAGSDDSVTGHGGGPHRKGPLGSSLLSRLPFMRPMATTSPSSPSSPSSNPAKPANPVDPASRPPGSPPLPTSAPSPPSLPAAIPKSLSEALHKTRRRKGSLRKVALLSRGAQRNSRESRSLPADDAARRAEPESSPRLSAPVTATATALRLSSSQLPHHEAATPNGSGLSQPARSAADVAAFPLPPSPHSSGPTPPTTVNGGGDRKHRVADDNGAAAPSYASRPRISYTSTTDEEDVLQMPKHTATAMSSSSSLSSAIQIQPPPKSQSSGSESYLLLPTRASLQQQRRRSIQRTKSPLSYAAVGLSASPLLPPPEWDYSETEWWGWVVLAATWFVFVVGMGSCLGVWSWSWDVGETPHATPEQLGDDPTLPIVGYYPALMILSCIMAWVWVVVAWVGMKYFRHAKISGD